MQSVPACAPFGHTPYAIRPPVPYIEYTRCLNRPASARARVCAFRRFVAGEPIPPPPLEPGQKHPSPQQVDELHAAFYAAVEKLWHKHREGFPGYERVKLVMV